MKCVNTKEELITNINWEKQRRTGHPQIIVHNYNSSQVEELVFLDGGDFKKISGESDKERGRNKSTIVKITNPENKKRIYRLLRTSSDIKNMNGYVGLSYTSIRKLTNSAEGMDALQNVRVSEGAIIPFYWNHPSPAFRISLKMAVGSILLSIISIAVTLICSL